MIAIVGFGKNSGSTVCWLLRSDWVQAGTADAKSRRHPIHEGGLGRKHRIECTIDHGIVSAQNEPSYIGLQPDAELS